MEKIRQFKTGATRNLDESKPDYEAFISPFVVHRYGEFMHSHRKQKDGKLRPGDNWQLGMGFDVFMKSLDRHEKDMHLMHRGGKPINHDTGKPCEKEELLCAIIFNASGYLDELLKGRKYLK